MSKLIRVLVAVASQCKCVEHAGLEPWHGIPSGYIYHGCRCEDCSAVISRKRAAHYRDNKSDILRHRKSREYELKQYLADYRKTHKDQLKEYNAGWHERNPDANASYARKRRAHIRGNGSEPYIAESVFSRDNWICQLCYSPIDPELPRNDYWGATIDHIIPISKGGPDSPDNVQAAHWVCNVKKNNRTEIVRI